MKARSPEQGPRLVASSNDRIPQHHEPQAVHLFNHRQQLYSEDLRICDRRRPSAPVVEFYCDVGGSSPMLHTNQTHEHMKRTIILSAAALLLSGAARSQSACTELLLNGGFEDTWAFPFAYTSCTSGGNTSIPQWLAYQSWAGGYNHNKVTSGTGVAWGFFPTTANPNNWNNDPNNDHYVNWQITSNNVSGDRMTFVQNLSTPLVAGQQYYVRFRYAAARTSATPNTPYTFRVGVVNNNTCAAAALSTPAFTPTVPAIGFNNAPWGVYTGVITATAGANQFRLDVVWNQSGVGYGGKVWLDDIQLVCKTCKFDFDEDEVVDVDDLNLFTSYYGTSVNQLPLCHRGADCNNDGTVSVADLLEFIAAFGSTCPGTQCGGLLMPMEPGHTVTPTLKRMSQDDGGEAVLFPNPSSGQVNLALPAGTVNALVEIKDASGRSLLTQRTTDESIVRFDLSALAAGHYLLLYGSDSGSGAIRFMKE